MLVRLEQPSKALLPISVTDGGMEMSVRLEQKEKAKSPIFVTDGGDGDVREAGATREGEVPNHRNRWRDRNTCEVGKAAKSAVPRAIPTLMVKGI